MTNNNKNMLNVPNLRFEGFEGAWKISSFQEISEKITDGTHDTPKQSLQGVPYLTAIHIKDGEIDYKNCYFVAEDIHMQIYKRCNPEKGDLLIVNIGAGTATCAVNTVEYQFSMKNVALIKPKRHIVDSLFVAQFQRRQSKKIFTQLTSGGAQPFLSLKEIGKLKIYHPELLEQNKISSFLTLIDGRMQTQSKIIEQLKSLSSGLKDAIFLKKIKFNSLQENWRTYKVSDLLEFFSTNSLSWENLEYDIEGTHNLHYGIIHKSNSPRLDLTKQILPSIKSEFTSNKFSLCKDGDIVFADASEDTNDIGKAIEFVNCNDKKVVSGLHTIHGRDKLILTIVGFKGFAFTASKFRNQIKRLGQGTKVYSISEKNFKDCSIDIPPISEQVKITGILTYIDEKLIIETNLLRKLNKQKDALLKELFI